MKETQVAEQMTVLHFIDGSDVPSRTGRTFASLNPATGEEIAEVAFGDHEDIDRAVTAAWRAYDDGSWRHMAPTERAKRLRRIACLIRDRSSEIAQLEALDAGKPIVDSRSEVEVAAAILEYASTLPENVRGDVYAQSPGYFSYSSREPYGVVGAIAPWNFPFLLAVAKTAAPLALGNSVVLKMAEQTPLSTRVYAHICAEAGLPAGVLNVVHGDGPTTGAALVQHPRVPKITFTGSTETGRRVLEGAAACIKSCHLELGGKTPNIILDDADLDQALAGTLFTSFWTSGQVCTSGSRLLVHERVADDFVSELVNRAQRLAIGDPLAETTHLGPLVSGEQLERVKAYVRHGRDAGASLATGGEAPQVAGPLAHGFFIEPTIFTDVNPKMRVAQEEIFGPVLSVLPFRDDDDAIALANGVAYGLAATVWTKDLSRAFRFSEQLEAGTIWTNWPHGGAPHIPYEGHKHSGMGEDGGLESIGTFTKLKVSHINTTGSRLEWGGPSQATG